MPEHIYPKRRSLGPPLRILPLFETPLLVKDLIFKALIGQKLSRNGSSKNRLVSCNFLFVIEMMLNDDC